MIIFLEPSHPKWMDFCLLNENATIFHHPAWLKTIAETYDYKPFVVTTTDSNGNIQAGLPMMEISTPIIGKHWVSLPFSDYISILSLDPEMTIKLLYSLHEGVMENYYPEITIRNAIPLNKQIFTNSENVLHILRIDNEENLLKKIHPMHRRSINKAKSNNLKVGYCYDKTSIDQFYTLHLHTRQRHGVPVQPKKYFDNLWENIIEPELGFVALVYKEDIVIAGAIFLHFQKTLTYKYGASYEKFWHLRPNHILFWDVIQWAYQHGFQLLDFGKTNCHQQSLREFKSRWGADEQPLTYSTMSKKQVQLNISSQKFLTRLINTIIRNSPTIVCKHLGEWLYKYVG